MYRLPKELLAGVCDMKSLVIIDYGSGNLHSVQQSATRVADEHSLEWRVKTSCDPKDVADADHIILPGVGHFADCKYNLSKIQDMEHVLEQRVQNDAIAFLGICVGMQLMASTGFEGNAVPGLNWISGNVKPLKPEPEANLKIPHTGWNKIMLQNYQHSFSSKVADKLFYYFVHSYHFIPDNTEHCLAVTDYGEKVTAIIGKENKIGTQFHPEKSQKAGLNLLSAFLNWQI